MNGQPIVPPAAPPSPQPPPARRVGSLVLVVLAWVVILGVVGLIMWAGLRPRTPEPSAGSASSSSSSRAAATELLIESRVQVGFAHLVGNRNAGKPPAGRSLAASLDHPKRSTADRLRLVTVVGELSGGKAALKRLDELDKQDLPKGAKDEA